VGVLLGDPLKIKSVRGIFYDRKTLMKVLMSFYKDREEDVDVTKEEKECVYV
jgi:hypothetical protein